MRTGTAIALSLSLLLASPLWADRLILETGRQLEGVVLEESDSDLVFQLKSGARITLSRSEVQDLVRSGTSEVDLMEGDAFFAKKQYEKAFECYLEARANKNPLAARRLDELNRALHEEVDRLLEGTGLDDAEEILRDRVRNTPEKSLYHSIYTARLSRLLSAKGKRAFGKRSYELAAKYFSEAWDLDPRAGDFGREYLQVLEITRTPSREILQFLLDYTQYHPEDTELAEELAIRIWKRRPCQAADLLAPAGIPPNSTRPEVVSVLPSIFRRCFFEEPFPASALLDRIEYYRIYLSLEPEGDRRPLYEALLREDPNRVETYSEYASYLVEQKRSSEAEKIYRRLLEIDPDSTEAKIFLAEWEKEKERILFREELDRIARLEKPYLLVRSLTQDDFPLLKDSSRIQDLLRMARQVASVLDSRPPEMEGAESLSAGLIAVRAYRSRLEDENAQTTLRRLLIQTDRSPVTPRVGDPAPPFELEDLRGNRISLDDFKGQIVLLYFWATWCPRCRAEIGFAVTSKNMLKNQNVQFIGISLDKERSILSKFLKQNPEIDWPLVFGGKGWETPAARVYGVTSIPAKFLIDKDGTIRLVNPSPQELFNEIFGLRSEKPGQPRPSLKVYGAPFGN